QPPPDEAPDEEAEQHRPEAIGLKGLAWMQIGPTGLITADRQVRVSDCPPEEPYIRCKLDEPPPMAWKPCLTLEWYSQNGRVLVELVDPEIEWVETDAGTPESDSLSALRDVTRNPEPFDAMLAGDETERDTASDDPDDFEWAGGSSEDFDDEEE